MDKICKESFKLFFPHLHSDHEEIKNSQIRFVHYTSAENALKILDNKELWLRQPYCMNDYKEFIHGVACLKVAYENSNLNKVVDKLYEGLSSEVEDVFNELIRQTYSNLFIFCLSEHLCNDEIDEDRYGRLSMWRGYGKAVGVGLVFKREPFIINYDEEMDDTDEPFILKVNYQAEKSFNSILNDLSESLSKRPQILKSISREKMHTYLVRLLQMLALSGKHAGFREEREWRFVHTDEGNSAPYLKRETEVMNGIPQDIFKVSIEKLILGDKKNLSMFDLIDRIIVGPTQYPTPIYNVFVSKLKSLGFSDAESRVIVSDIPLRN